MRTYCSEACTGGGTLADYLQMFSLFSIVLLSSFLRVFLFLRGLLRISKKSCTKSQVPPVTVLFTMNYWVTRKLPQICTVIFRIRIGKVAWFAVYICGNFWVTQYFYTDYFFLYKQRLTIHKTNLLQSSKIVLKVVWNEPLGATLVSYPNIFLLEIHSQIFFYHPDESKIHTRSWKTKLYESGLI